MTIGISFLVVFCNAAFVFLLWRAATRLRVWEKLKDFDLKVIKATGINIVLFIAIGGMVFSCTLAMLLVMSLSLVDNNPLLK